MKEERIGKEQVRSKGRISKILNTMLLAIGAIPVCVILLLYYGAAIAFVVFILADIFRWLLLVIASLVTGQPLFDYYG